jgi:hypothetical protein
MQNIFIRLFAGSLSVPDAYGITVVRTLIVIIPLSVLNITNVVMTRCCEFVHICSYTDALYRGLPYLL